MIDRRGFLRWAMMASLALGLAGLSGPVLADELDSLRVGGQVIERFDGYLEAAAGSAKAAVDRYNAQRRQVYTARAAEQGVSVDQVGRVYAREIFNKAPAGTKFRREDGSVVTK